MKKVLKFKCYSYIADEDSKKSGVIAYMPISEEEIKSAEFLVLDDDMPPFIEALLKQGIKEGLVLANILAEEKI